ncbi:fatty acyl-AMP ligase [Hansschlegelia zhihuaiae]|uniref:Fatty acyl-AMP ligase n=1 Tax=Hansschlegelia zhihuaiae TaxID=405005 RepID=A0A4V1KJK0_9HYPH|nr:fatty acyl-AMP ligase [Hansschlegelia zhihuaiae]RXF74462.1 fatty acyl-AMP ligase [Hansschlegelia zhihuaiae]
MTDTVAPTEAPDFLTAFRRHAAARADQTALRWLERGERPTDHATYADLDAMACVTAANLLRLGLRGRPVLFLLPQGLDFVRCFLGCLYAGAIPVPAPLSPGRRNQDRALAIAQAARPAAALARSADAEAAEGVSAALRLSGVSDIQLIASEDLLSGAAAEAPVTPDPDQIAFLQYTSGSTSAPKGVVVTHRNLAATLDLIRQAFRQEADSSAVSWLPLHHDMGLVGCVLEPLYLGARVSLMSPLAFLQRPARWLQAMHDWQATTAGAPNFAYDLCARLVTEEQSRGLDLSRWTLAFCGAEPVRPATLRRFAERFAPHGFGSNAFYPCYGLAEATLLVTGGAAGEGVRTRNLPLPQGRGERESVSCGVGYGDTRIMILDPGSEEILAPGRPGEICVSGSQVSPGFWSGETGRALPDPSREVRLDGRSWLRTGDIGLIAEGDLHVIGRLKSMIIVRGANIYAEDVEQTALAVDAALAAAAAIPIHGEASEDLVLICEAARGQPLDDPEEILRRLSAAVAEQHGLLPAEVLLAPFGAIERTPSGKIQRLRLRDRYAADDLTVIARLRRPVTTSEMARA